MGSAILFIKTCLSAIGNRICQFWSAQIRKECGVWKRGSLQHCVWFKLNLFFFGKQNSSKPHLWGKPQQSELAVVFLLLCNWPTFPCFNTGKKKKKKDFGLLETNHIASLLTTKRKLGVEAVGLIPTVS